MKPLRKPKAKSAEALHWFECTDYIEQRHNVDTHDFAKANRQFGEWCDSKGYGKTDPKGLDRGSSQIWFAEFKAEIAAGKVVERPYQNFWHWLIDTLNVASGSTFTLSSELADGAEPWAKKILDLYLKEFGTGPYYVEL